MSSEKEEEALARKEVTKSRFLRGLPSKQMPVVISGEVLPCDDNKSNTDCRAVASEEERMESGEEPEEEVRICAFLQLRKMPCGASRAEKWWRKKRMLA